MCKKWTYSDEQDYFVGAREIVKNLPDGLYRLNISPFGDPVAHKMELCHDEMIQFKNGPMPAIITEMRRFWQSAERYKKLGVSHKRGILMYGPPGCGKTGIISCAINETISQHGLCFQVDDAENFRNGVKMMRQIENGRPIVALIEDIEQVCRRDEEELLEVMDGASSIGDGILFLATTNDLRNIPRRIRCRPSRIDTLVLIDFPTIEQRIEYLQFLMAPDNAKNSIMPIAQETDNFSLAMLKELVLAIRVYEKPLDMAIQTLRDLVKEDDSE